MTGKIVTLNDAKKNDNVFSGSNRVISYNIQQLYPKINIVLFIVSKTNLQSRILCFNYNYHTHSEKVT